MKKLIMLCALILLPLVSCEDIIDSDQNIVKEKVVYNHVLEDQSNSVIKPLKTGNIWIYDVYTYDSQNTSQFEKNIDTLIVLDQIEIKDEKWFKLNKKTPHGFRFLTNTDKGLFQNCNCPDDGTDNDIIILKAQYPAKIGDKNIGQTNPVLISDQDGFHVVHESSMIQVLSAIESISVNNKIYDNCYQYTTYGDVTDNNGNIIIRDTLFVDYYSPNIGLIKSIFFYNKRDSNYQKIPRIVMELKDYELK